VYEICYFQGIRQFHEIAGVRRTAGGQTMTSRVVETEHSLGKYNGELAEAVPDEEEWKLVVNATSGGKSFGDGNGAYYQAEYTGGDVCDHSDVTDSAVVAGSTGSRGLQRSSTARFYCGQRYDVQVSEDHTCHYIVEVKVPELCRHPLFRAPVSKKQVMKCLPVH
jgi:Glucosidase II beta subunit-like protein